MTVTTATTTTDRRSRVRPNPAVPGGARLLLHQMRFEVLFARRNPVFLGFTMAMPLMMLVIFSLLLADATEIGPLTLTYRQFLVPNVVVLALLSSCFASLGISLAIRRGTGELKRLRGTPLPPWVTLAAPALQTAAMGWITAGAVVVCGRWWFGVTLPSPLPFVVLLAVAAPSLAALGTAVATFVDRAQNAPAVTNVLLWPVAFISGTFTWVDEGSVLHRISQVLPVRHLNDAALAASPPGGSSIAASSLAVVALWGVIGAVVATRRFTWDPPAAD